MLYAFVIAARLCAIVIVDPQRAMLGAGFRIIPFGGIIIVFLVAGFVMTYVLPFVLAVVAIAIGFALLVALFVGLFSPSQNNNPSPYL
ncbi:hypothetical protein KRR38_31580 [Novosphingobium sp. G106]|nr:hypothetical protein [Novosphingobium sp. G106]